MSENKKKKHRKVVVVLVVLVLLCGAGYFAYGKVTDVVSEKLVTKIAESEAANSSSTADAENIYDSMSEDDQATVKKIATNHMSAANVKKATEYLSNNDTEGLKEYAYETLSSSEIAELKELYNKYSSGE